MVTLTHSVTNNPYDKFDGIIRWIIFALRFSFTQLCVKTTRLFAKLRSY